MYIYHEIVCVTQSAGTTPTAQLLTSTSILYVNRMYGMRLDAHPRIFIIIYCMTAKVSFILTFVSPSVVCCTRTPIWGVLAIASLLAKYVQQYCRHHEHTSSATG